MRRNVSGPSGQRAARSSSLRKSSRSAGLRRGRAGIEISPRSRGRPGRSRRLRVRRVLWLIAAALMLTLAGEVVYAAYTSYRFTLRRVIVEGASPATRALVLQQAPAPGPNLFALSKKQLARRVQSLSFVQSVALDRRPPGTLVIQVKERRPIACLRQGEQNIFLDDAGVAFARPGPLPAGLIEMRGISLSRSAMGRPTSGTAAAALLRGLFALAQNPNLKVKLLTADGNGWLTAQLASGCELRFGPAAQLEKKCQLAEAALAALGPARPAEYLDLSAPEAPVWKPLAGAKVKSPVDLESETVVSTN